MMKRNAFTLAEVLTTLMVIGVVAAMTIPALINSTDDQQNKVALKKAMSVLNQAVQLNVAKEVDETFPTANSVGLATWMANSLSGTLNGSTITTPDGMSYTFIVTGATANLTACGATAPAAGATIGAIPCGVMVDVNGSGKGTKTIPTEMSATATVSDQYPLTITKVGVYPYVSDTYSNAWCAMYGKSSAPNGVNFSTACK